MGFYRKEKPFCSKRDYWSDVYYVIVEYVDCEILPYGKAYGYPTINGTFSNHFMRNKRWRENRLIPNVGLYSWIHLDVVIEPKENL